MLEELHPIRVELPRDEEGQPDKAGQQPLLRFVHRLRLASTGLVY